jgi:hypothetical protein
MELEKLAEEKRGVRVEGGVCFRNKWKRLGTSSFIRDAPKAFSSRMIAPCGVCAPN